jgi:hypothetical protein
MSALPVTEPQPAADTAPVSVALSNIRRGFGGGQVKLRFDVEFDFGGIGLKILGFSVVARDNQLKVLVPQHRDECGRWVPSLGLPQELHEPIAKLALDSLGVKHSVVIRPPAA